MAEKDKSTDQDVLLAAVGARLQEMARLLGIDVGRRTYLGVEAQLNSEDPREQQAKSVGIPWHSRDV